MLQGTKPTNIIQVAQKATNHKYRTAIEEVVDGMERGLDFLDVPNATFWVTCPSEHDFPEGDQLAATPAAFRDGLYELLKQPEWKDGHYPATSVILCHMPGALPYLRCLKNAGLVTFLHTLPDFDEDASILHSFYHFADQGIRPYGDESRAREMWGFRSGAPYLPYPQINKNFDVPRTRNIDVLWVGRHTARKRPDLAGTILGHLDTFTLTNDGGSASTYEIRKAVYLDGTAEELNRMLGRPSTDKENSLRGVSADDAYPRAKVFLSTSEYEASPRTVVKAGLSGCALVLLNREWSQHFRDVADLTKEGVLYTDLASEIGKKLVFFPSSGPWSRTNQAWFKENYTPEGGAFLTRLRSLCREWGFTVR